MLSDRDVLTALDGAMASASALISFCEEGSPERQGLVGVIAAIATARTMVEEIPEEPGGCPHPPHAVLTRRAGSTVMRLCEDCSSFID
jgi:hypothetical protein